MSTPLEELWVTRLAVGTFRAIAGRDMVTVMRSLFTLSGLTYAPTGGAHNPARANNPAEPRSAARADRL
jgi:hypothetical protein